MWRVMKRSFDFVLFSLLLHCRSTLVSTTALTRMRKWMRKSENNLRNTDRLIRWYYWSERASIFKNYIAIRLSFLFDATHFSLQIRFLIALYEYRLCSPINDIFIPLALFIWRFSGLCKTTRDFPATERVDFEAYLPPNPWSLCECTRARTPPQGLHQGCQCKTSLLLTNKFHVTFRTWLNTFLCRRSMTRTINSWISGSPRRDVDCR